MTGWVLITGGSTGIGLELARVFAANRFNVVLAARNEERLKKNAAELEAKYGIKTRIISKDLCLPDSPKELFDALADLPISILVNNAGFGWRGAFAECDLNATALNMMQLNMNTLVALTRLFLPGMLQRREGKILNVASIAAFQPGPFTNIYFATKAFVFSFSTALSEELAGTGVTVTALCPGTTRTEFFDRAGMRSARLDSIMMGADVVAEAGYRGLMRGKRVVIPGLMNKIVSVLGRITPPSWSTRIIRKINGR